jgi:hypothetical protein
MIMDNFLRGYITCALWSSSTYDENGENGKSLDSDEFILSNEAHDRMREDCEDFFKHHEADLSEYCARITYDPSQGEPEDYAGHDFWLTRNGHGAGFWDRGLGELGERLSEAAKAYGSVDLYPMQDGRIYQS